MTETIRIFQIDAFTQEPFKGNPAAVCLLSHDYEDAILRAIAAEMNLSETAFVIPLDTEDLKTATHFSLRWFTPQVEVRLCGHATLATGAVLLNVIGVSAPQITFETLSRIDRTRRRHIGGNPASVRQGLPLFLFTKRGGKEKGAEGMR
jgi:PhzF family phenazine biosynthesis protein